MKSCFLIIILLDGILPFNKTKAQENYLEYHSIIIECEHLIVEGEYTLANNIFDSLFHQFEFLFLRDVKLATAVSAIVKDYQSGLNFIKLGMKAGWTLEDINRSDQLKSFREQPEWTQIISDYDSLHQIYLKRINTQLREKVHEMFRKDQAKAFRALLRLGQKSKRRYAERKFAPHSELQLMKMEQFLDEVGYPGEKWIGNDLWTSVILSHHNSISETYNSKDTLYARLKPKLLKALKKGEISPYEYAQIEDWKIAALNDHEFTNYGFIGDIPNDLVRQAVNDNRARIGLRSIELRNSLVDLENETGINLYLPKGWQNEKIEVRVLSSPF